MTPTDPTTAGDRDSLVERLRNAHFHRACAGSTYRAERETSLYLEAANALEVLNEVRSKLTLACHRLRNSQKVAREYETVEVDLRALADVLVFAADLPAFQPPAADEVEAVRQSMVSAVFQLAQPDRGDVFSWFDDHAEEIASHAITTLRSQQSSEVEPVNTCEMPEVAAMRYIEQLRAEEGDSVRILCDDPEAWTKDKRLAIECCGEWTDWQELRFYGESVLQCLAKAIEARTALARSQGDGE